MALRHSSHKYAYTLLRVEALHIFSDFYYFGIEAERNLATIRGQMIGDWVLDDLEKPLLRRRRSNREAMEQLDHEPCETLEGTWNADSRADFDQNTLGGVNVDLQLACFVDGRVEEG